jgi:hypothetical protein
MVTTLGHAYNGQSATKPPALVEGTQTERERVALPRQRCLIYSRSPPKGELKPGGCALQGAESRFGREPPRTNEDPLVGTPTPTFRR